jgi:tRNA G10  N-methylase Trm11
VLLDFSPHPTANGRVEVADSASSAEGPRTSPTVQTYLGRVVGSGGMREELVKYDLKKRLYIGPTSLDHTLAIIMANSCLVKKGSLVLDPFVGTASVLVSAIV